MRRSASARVAVALAAATLCIGARPAGHQDEGLPDSSLRVLVRGEWREWWRAARAPSRWTSSPLLPLMQWTRSADGVEWGSLRLAGRGEAWRIRVIVVRLDPARLRFSLPLRLDAEGRSAWTADSASARAVLAVNAGQFTQGVPWGWIVREGHELQGPGYGPLSAAFVIDSAGRASIVPANRIEAMRTAGTVRMAFQSYPLALLSDAEVPLPLRGTGHGVDVAHRDARLAIGVQRDGRIIVALTRFDAAGEGLESLPFGLTVPESAALMGALGARQALLLDGGISAQLLLRDSKAGIRVWHGHRAVPMGLEAVPR